MSSNIQFIFFNIINIVSEKPTFKCSLGKNMAETSSQSQYFVTSLRATFMEKNFFTMKCFLLLT